MSVGGPLKPGFRPLVTGTQRGVGDTAGSQPQPAGTSAATPRLAPLGARLAERKHPPVAASHDPAAHSSAGRDESRALAGWLAGRLSEGGARHTNSPPWPRCGGAPGPQPPGGSPGPAGGASCG